MDTTGTSAWERALPPALTLTTQCPHVSPGAPHAADLALLLRARRSVTMKVRSQIRPLKRCLQLSAAAIASVPSYLLLLQVD